VFTSLHHLIDSEWRIVELESRLREWKVMD